MSTLPPAPPEEDQADPHCGVCGSLFHPTANHPDALSRVLRDEAAMATAVEQWPPGYNPAEADELIGRAP